MNVCVKQRFHMAFHRIDQVGHQSAGGAVSGIRDRKMICRGRLQGDECVCEAKVPHGLPWDRPGGTPVSRGSQFLPSVTER